MDGKERTVFFGNMATKYGEPTGVSLYTPNTYFGRDLPNTHDTWDPNSPFFRNRIQKQIVRAAAICEQRKKMTAAKPDATRIKSNDSHDRITLRNLIKIRLERGRQLRAENQNYTGVISAENQIKWKNLLIENPDILKEVVSGLDSADLEFVLSDFSDISRKMYLNPPYTKPNTDHEIFDHFMNLVNDAFGVLSEEEEEEEIAGEESTTPPSLASVKPADPETQGKEEEEEVEKEDEIEEEEEEISGKMEDVIESTGSSSDESYHLSISSSSPFHDFDINEMPGPSYSNITIFAQGSQMIHNISGEGEQNPLPYCLPAPPPQFRGSMCAEDTTAYTVDLGGGRGTKQVIGHKAKMYTYLIEYQFKCIRCGTQTTLAQSVGRHGCVESVPFNFSGSLCFRRCDHAIDLKDSQIPRRMFSQGIFEMLRKFVPIEMIEQKTAGDGTIYYSVNTRASDLCKCSICGEVLDY